MSSRASVLPQGRSTSHCHPDTRHPACCCLEGRHYHVSTLTPMLAPGEDFDGLVVFDESHKAKNLVPEAGSKPTKVGAKVMDLQQRLPKARVVYCSATGACSMSWQPACPDH